MKPPAEPGFWRGQSSAIVGVTENRSEHREKQDVKDTLLEKNSEKLISAELRDDSGSTVTYPIIFRSVIATNPILFWRLHRQAEKKSSN